MGRFTLRDEGRTIALGKVLKYKPFEKKTADSEDREIIAQRIDLAQKEKALAQREAEDAKTEE